PRACWASHGGWRGRLPRDAHPLVLDEIDGRLRLASARLHDVAVEEAALGDDERVRLDVAVHPPGGGDLDVAGRHHRALVHPPDEGVDRLNVGAHHALLANHQLLADLQLAADGAFDVDGLGDVELPFDPRAVAD